MCVLKSYIIHRMLSSTYSTFTNVTSVSVRFLSGPIKNGVRKGSSGLWLEKNP